MCRLSELRSYELLEGLCQTMTAYELTDEGSWELEPRTFDKPLDLSHARKRKRKEDRRQLQAYCERIVETNEDELVASLRSSSSTSESA